MPRKKVADPIDTILTFAETATTETLQIMRGLIDREIKKRTSTTGRPPGTTTTGGGVAVQVLTTTPTPPASAKPKRKPLTASSAKPVNEATPLVPPQATVGEDDDNENVG